MKSDFDDLLNRMESEEGSVSILQAPEDKKELVRKVQLEPAVTAQVDIPSQDGLKEIKKDIKWLKKRLIATQ